MRHLKAERNLPLEVEFTIDDFLQAGEGAYCTDTGFTSILSDKNYLLDRILIRSAAKSLGFKILDIVDDPNEDGGVIFITDLPWEAYSFLGDFTKPAIETSDE